MQWGVIKCEEMSLSVTFTCDCSGSRFQEPCIDRVRVTKRLIVSGSQWIQVGMSKCEQQRFVF